MAATCCAAFRRGLSDFANGEGAGPAGSVEEGQRTEGNAGNVFAAGRDACRFLGKFMGMPGKASVFCGNGLLRCAGRMC